jgi:hypothetical protein
MVRALPFAALTLALALAVAGCGGDSGADGAGASEPSGDAGDSSAGEPAGTEDAVDVCALVTAEQVGAVLGATVTLSEVPGGGCTFGQEDPRATSVALSSSVVDEAAGGFDGAVSGVTAVVEGEPVDVPVGDRGLLVVGPAFGGESDQGGGLVQIGSTLVQVTLLQGGDLSADEVGALTTDVLQLAADAL